MKFDLPASSGAASAFRRIADGYGLTLLLETGPVTLRGRGWEETAGPPTAWWARYRSWSRRVPTIARLLRTRRPGPRPGWRHADHVLVRTAAERSGRRVVYYSDFPYNQTSAADGEFIRRYRLAARAWERDLDRKAELIRGYRAQADALFPGGRIPRAPEVYLLPEAGPGPVPRTAGRLPGTRARTAGGVT
ncbi:hypothetical protein STANM309S_01187 [Streptomyces tanashiensis]